MCELTINLRTKDFKEYRINDLRKLINENKDINLLEELKDSKINLKWPYKQPEYTGEARYMFLRKKLRSEKKISRLSDFSPRNAMTHLSSIFTLMITLPCSFFVIYILLKEKFHYPETKSALVSVVISLIIFIAELIVFIRDEEKLFNKDKMINDLYNKKLTPDIFNVKNKNENPTNEKGIKLKKID